MGCYRRRVKERCCLLLARDPDQVPHISLELSATWRIKEKGSGQPARHYGLHGRIVFSSPPMRETDVSSPNPSLLNLWLTDRNS